jgi:hypothetical protein
VENIQCPQLPGATPIMETMAQTTVRHASPLAKLLRFLFEVAGGVIACGGFILFLLVLLAIGETGGPNGVSIAGVLMACSVTAGGAGIAVLAGWAYMPFILSAIVSGVVAVAILNSYWLGALAVSIVLAAASSFVTPRLPRRVGKGVAKM